jgi:hypothetical protein
MYAWADIMRSLSNPELIAQKIKYLYKKTFRCYHDRLNTQYGIEFVKEDWDNLILLDACRYDLFEEENTIEGNLSEVKSNASSSMDFFRKNFDGGEFGDIVYYSANPHIDKYDIRLNQIYRLWELDWDAETGTVLPKDAVNRVLETEPQHRDKRLVLHMMQPHRPFLGDLAENFEQPGFSAQGVNIPRGAQPDIPFWWDRLEAGNLSRDHVWKMYCETLRVTLPHVQRLVDELPGKSVISADHGNAFGENGLYGHPTRTHHKTVLSVPWLEIEKPRKDVLSGPATAHSHREHYHDATEQLEALGYK